ncbi:MAG: alanine racemase [Rhodospirillales bacterium]|jgi:alanine racemase|nr:alanine racemase [Rhodospirillales bacterium]MDP6883460.1 alanine racemase [Rhodospirillales bacterium]
MSKSDHSGAVLTIDLNGIVANWLLLKSMLADAECAAVIKADAYGLGAERVAPALARAGCETFFVAQVDEGVAVRRVAPAATIHVLGGPVPGSEETLIDHQLVPVLNSLGDIEAWGDLAHVRGAPLPADLHIDTGMARLGLPPDETAILIREPERLDGIEVATVMSHLACADEADHPLNRQQLADFLRARHKFSHLKASFANSSGIFLGPEYHFDLARPGVSLYGVGPRPGETNPMAQVVRLQGKILQVRDVDRPQTVGYGASHRVARRGRVATVGVGYADGYLRSLSNSGCGYMGDIRVPIVGRVSMDLITLDVSDVADDAARPGAPVDLIGPHNPVDSVAAEAGTIGHEILTGLGSRYHRVYLDGAD